MKFLSSGGSEDGTNADIHDSKSGDKITMIVKPVQTQKMPETEVTAKGDNSEGTFLQNAATRMAALNGSSDSDDLSRALSKCQIEDKTDCDNLSVKVSNLQITDKSPSENDDGLYIDLKAQETEENEIKEDEKAVERGPTGGQPVNYRPCIPGYNHIAAKGYAFNANTSPLVLPNSGYNTYGQMQMQSTYQQPMESCYQLQNTSKRSRDYDEQPFKYTRPAEVTNNLNDPTKIQNTNMTHVTYSKVSTSSCSGGHVIVKSPEIEQPMPLWQSNQVGFGEQTTSGEFDLLKHVNESLGDNVGFPNLNQQVDMNFLGNQESYLEQTFPNLNCLINKRRTGSDKRTSFSTEGDATSEGYFSDAPSPYSESQGSPADVASYTSPPSNNSVDSGMCIATVPSPGSHIDTNSPSSTMSGFDVDMFPPSPVKSGLAFGQGNHDNGINYAGYDFSDLPAENISFPNTAPLKAESNDKGVKEFIDANLANLKDVMDTIANDMRADKEKQKAKLAGNKRIPVEKPVMPPSAVQHPPQMTKNIPVIRVPPNQNQLTPVTSAPVLLMKPPQNTMAVPISVGPNVVCSTSGPQVSKAPSSNSQIVIIPAQPQPAPTILVVTQPPPPKPKYKHILPRIQPNPPPSQSPSLANKNIPTTVVSKAVTTPKPVAMTTKPTSMVAPVMAQPQQRPRPPPSNPKCVNQLNIARRLVATMKTEDLEDTDKEGDTYLHIAVCRADKFMVQALLERIEREKLHGMIDTQNSERQTPVYLAVSANQPEMVQMLIQHGADVNLLAERVGNSGQKEVKAAIHCAVTNGKEYLPTLKALLTSPDLNIDMVNSDGCTALHCAILEHNQPRQYEMEEGGKIRTVTGPPIDSKPIIEALIKARADPNAQDKKSGKTAFMYALETRDYSLVEKLISLVDVMKVRSYFRSQAFDGTTCIKIMESRKTEFPPILYEKLQTILSNSRNTFSPH